MKEFSDNDLAISVGKNTMFGLTANIVRIGTRIIMVPFIISYLGLEGYGIWAIMMVIMVCMQMGVSGVKSAFQKYVAEATGTGDYERASILLSTSFIVVAAVYVSVLIPVVLFSHDLVRVLGVPDRFILDAGSSIVLLAFVVTLNNVTGVFESMIMGAHRIDIVMKLDMFLLSAEACAIVLLLLNGYGLFALVVVISASQVCRSAFNFAISSRVIPQIRIRSHLVSRSALSELLRFAGSYQLLNIIDVLYLNILPLAILKFFGAEAAGIYAICARLVQAVKLAPEALLQPLLSGGAFMNYGMKAGNGMGLFLEKSLRATITMAIPVLAFVMVFGEKIIFVWAGQESELIFVCLILLCLTQLFRSVAKVNFVIYRAVGGATKDILWQLSRLIILLFGLGVAVFFFNFTGALAALLFAEFFGMILLFHIVKDKIVPRFNLGSLVRNTAKLIAIILTALAAGMAMVTIPVSLELSDRTMMTIRLGAALTVFISLTFPLLWLTNYFSREERQLLAKSLTLLFR